jgi:hypothetical protein
MFHHVGAHPLDFGALAFPGSHQLAHGHAGGHAHHPHPPHPHMTMDITETVQEFRVSCDLPGFKKVRAWMNGWMDGWMDGFVDWLVGSRSIDWVISKSSELLLISPPPP